MSPAGGQASLRIIYRANQTAVSATNISYMDTGPLGLLYTYHALVEGYDMEPNQTTMPFSMTGSLAAALMQDIETKSGPRDSWGNPKVPRLDMLDHSAADQNGWINVSQTPTVESFVSLFGLPLLGVPDQGTVEFGVESAYVQLKPVSIEKYEKSYETWKFEATCHRCTTYASHPGGQGSVSSGRLAQLLGPPWRQPNSTQLAQESFTDARRINLEQMYFGTNLSLEVTQVLVETQIVCEEGVCRATKVRPSATDHRPQNMTVFDFWGINAIDILNRANGENQWSPTMLELFLNETSTIPVYRKNSLVLNEGKDWNHTNLAQKTPEILSRRTSLVLNSAVHLLYSYYGFAGQLPSPETTDYGPPHIPADGLQAAITAYNATPVGISFGQASEYVSNIVSSGAAFVAASTEASVTRTSTIYRADYAWVTMLIVSSLALTIIGSIGIAMGLGTRGPDVFDPLMGLTYNNGSLGLPNPGSTLDANARAKLLRGMRVRLGDVAGGESVGMVGVGRVSEVEPLIKGRFYE